ncbi:hypothetical protein, partial [Klebsiella pneumoniae]|uniref:hypothetical protein n=1 Tax=Klebsiella pneumoniae TaxID=573 RepID=UPI001C6FBA27
AFMLIDVINCHCMHSSRGDVMLLSKNHSIVGLKLFHCSSIIDKLMNNIDRSGKNTNVKYLLMHGFKRVR